MNANKKYCRLNTEEKCSVDLKASQETTGALTSSQKVEMGKPTNASSFMNVSTFLENSGFSYGTVHKLWIMLEFEAIKNELWGELPLDIIICLDISKSMKNGKLLHLVATMQYFLTKLTSHHRLCIITFNQEVHFVTQGLVQTTEENKQDIRMMLNKIEPSGSTNIADALFKALDVLQQREPCPSSHARISSIMLFTDGLANVGLRGAEFNEALKRTPIPCDVVINTFGFGVHDSTMLRNIALSSCGGMYHYIPAVEAIPCIFGQCLAGLLNTVLYDVNVSLQACDGCRIVRFCTSYPIREKKENKDYLISFGSMFRNEKKSLLFRVSLKKLVAEWENHPLLVSVISFRTVHNGKEYQITNKFQVARPAVTPQTAIPFELDKQINRITAAQGFDQAIISCNKEDYAGAIQVLSGTAKKIEASASGQDPFCRELIQDLISCSEFMQEKMTFANAIHVANAYSSMHYAERSSGTEYSDPDALNNNNHNSLSPPSSPSPNAKSFLNRYQTFDQAEESKMAHRFTKDIISNYESFYDEEPASSTPPSPPQPTKISTFPLTELQHRSLQASQ